MRERYWTGCGAPTLPACSACSPAGSATSTGPRRPCRTRSPRRSTAGPTRACQKARPAGWSPQPGVRRWTGCVARPPAVRSWRPSRAPRLPSRPATTNSPCCSRVAILLPQATMAQRLVRAKRHLRERGVRVEAPPPEEYASRLPAVLAVIYLIYNEGYLASSRDAPQRRDLAREALDLARQLADLMPAEPEVAGLSAL